MQGGVHVQHFMAAGIDQCLHHDPGKATPTELFKGEDAVDFVPVRVQPATRNGGKCPVDKGAKYAVFFGVGLLLVVMVPGSGITAFISWCDIPVLRQDQFFRHHK